MAAVKRLDTLRRIGVTAVALAAAAGCVWLMRYVAREIAEGAVVAASGNSGEVEPDRVPAPKTYDLSKLVPEELRLNIGGLASEITSKRMEMPLEQAVETSANEARAAGWEDVSLPLAYQLATTVTGGGVYVTPDRRIVRRTHGAIQGGGTLREDFSFPAGPLLSLKRDMTLDEVVALRGDRVREKLPEVLRSVQIARPMYTQYTAHGNGASLLVAGLAAGDERMVRLQLPAAYLREGWKPHERSANIWTKANLTATWDISSNSEGAGSVVAVRYSDDEVILSRKETEE